MIIKYAKIVFLTVMLVTSYVTAGIYLDNQSYATPRSVVHKIYVQDGGHGSMVMIAPGLALTAAHVAVNKKLLVNGKPTKVLKSNEELDLALVQVQQDCPCIKLGVIPALDSPVVAVGYPLDEGQWATVGTAQSYKPTRLTSNTPIAFGNSGGGLFQFQAGQWKLVGITIQVAGANLGFMGVPVFHMVSSVDINTIKRFIGYELE